ncbi:MAGE family-domain-containing protein [Dendryphion nanum]|uniref:MAGE family-domain-containing protein n=1 Tax=Dendryphion nanum TaxID=256645 RepID=A0A9P9EFA3_9PLEO|nr:MAGE family-domain-containing protein [Dendryphion nanum]
MPPTSRKRHAPTEDDEHSSTPTQPQNYRQQATQVAYDDDDDDDVDMEEAIESGSGSIAQLSKNLVRYALACEYSRTPIRRQDISQKILGVQSREFKAVFTAANNQLIDVFGMEMVELPNREKVTIRQKRAAAASESQSKTSGQWVLRNVLPDRFRTSTIMEPSQIPTAEQESSYVGFYSMVISLIMLSGGQISESKLDRYLRRMNTEHTTAVDNELTKNIMTRMAREGYIVKVKETSGGEEIIDYVVGPRGKVEVGEEGVANLVRKVYGEGTMDNLEQRLSRSLGIPEGGGPQNATAHGEALGGASQAGGGARRAPGRPRRRVAEDEDEEE